MSWQISIRKLDPLKLVVNANIRVWSFEDGVHCPVGKFVRVKPEGLPKLCEKAKIDNAVLLEGVHGSYLSCSFFGLILQVGLAEQSSWRK